MKRLWFLAYQRLRSRVPGAGRFLRSVPGGPFLSRRLPALLRPRRLSVRIDGLDIQVYTADTVLGAFLFQHGTWEPFESELFTNSIGAGMVVVDIGANLGYYTLLAARAVGESGRVIAFEPDPRNLDLLRRNVKRNGFADRVTIVAAALTGEPGTVQLFRDTHNLGAHSMVQANVSSAGAINVPAMTLDGALGELGMACVDVLKLDTQGAEGSIFSGAGRVLNKRPLRAFVEFWPCGLRNAGTDPTDFLLSLGDTYGFTVSLLDPARMLVIPKPSVDDVMRECTGDRHVDLLLEKH